MTPQPSPCPACGQTEGPEYVGKRKVFCSTKGAIFGGGCRFSAELLPNESPASAWERACLESACRNPRVRELVEEVKRATGILGSSGPQKPDDLDKGTEAFAILGEALSHFRGVV